MMKKLFISGLFMAICLFLFHKDLNAQNCTFGDLNAQNLSYSPGGNLDACRNVSVTAEWLQQGQNPYVVAEHQSTLIVSLPTEFIGTSGTLVVTATDGNIYWATPSLTNDEIQVPLQGIIPSGEAISITLSDIEINFTSQDPSKSVNISQSISQATTDCDSGNDEESISGVIINTTGPAVTDAESSCTESNLAINLSVDEGDATITSYSWTGPNGFTSTEQNPSLFVPQSDIELYRGEYYVAVTDANSCVAMDTISLDETNCLALPIELLHFVAIPGHNSVLLEWETATELNNSHFDIERSADGRQYQKIGEMAGQGTTSEIIAYSFTDVAPLNGKSYYRLKQVDYNGAYEYSHVEEVNRDSDSALKLFPNPVAAGSQFRVEGRQIRSVQVFNILGQLVLEESYDRPQNRVFLSTDHLAQGMYITRINNTTEKRMIIK